MHLITILFFTVLFSCGSSKSVSSYSKPSNSQKCIQGDCIDGLGTYQYGNGEKYEGYFRNGKKNGYGIYYFNNGDISWGGNKNGKNHYTTQQRSIFTMKFPNQVRFINQFSILRYFNSITI